MTTWVEAASILGRDPAARVMCPVCRVEISSSVISSEITASETTRTVVYHLACKQPDYAPILALATSWANALRLPLAKRTVSDDLVDVVDT